MVFFLSFYRYFPVLMTKFFCIFEKPNKCTMTSFINCVKFDNLEKFQGAYIKVPLSDKALKYFSQAFGGGKPVIEANLNGPFGGIISIISEKLPYRKHTLTKRNLQKKLTIRIPNAMKFASIQESTLASLSELLENMFFHYFISYVDGAVNCGSSETGAVDNFLAFYKIEIDEWENNAARMAYRRTKGSKK